MGNFSGTPGEQLPTRRLHRDAENVSRRRPDEELQRLVICHTRNTAGTL
jgi:hypothetical protein